MLLKSLSFDLNKIKVKSQRVVTLAVRSKVKLESDLDDFTRNDGLGYFNLILSRECIAV